MDRPREQRLPNWLADVFLPRVRTRPMMTNDARKFLRHLLETNSLRVQNDVLNRSKEIRDRVEVEIRKLLHEVSWIAEQALDRARRFKETRAADVAESGLVQPPQQKLGA